MNPMQNESKIPPQLKSNAFGFVKLRPKSKIPFEPDWQNNPYSFSQMESWATNGSNYGVLGGRGDLIIIDADSFVISDIVRNTLPTTFTVKTPKSGHHFYFLCPDIKKKIVLKKDSEHFGEIISTGSQVVGPGSIHPDTGTIYTIEHAASIATLTKEAIFSALVEYIPTDFPQRDPNIEISDIAISDVLQKSSIQTKAIGNRLVACHPVHGSENGNNFVVSPEKNVWHCFRCNSGGGALLLIAMLERIIDCSQAVSGGLRGEDFKKTLQISKDKYGFNIKPAEASKAPSEPSADQLEEIEARIKAIPEDTPKTKLPTLLQPILKELARFNHAQGDAILRHVIKERFDLINDDIKSYEKDLKTYRKELDDSDEGRVLSRGDVMQILQNEEDFKIVHPAQDYSNEIMSFTVKVQGAPFLLTSKRHLVNFEDALLEGFELKHMTVDTARLSYKGIREVLDDDAEVNIQEMYHKIFDYITRFIRFPNKAYANYLTLWIIGTYVFMIFRYYPYVWLNAEKGSGKTLLMEVLAAIAFNGELITSPTESVIFRDISNNLITMFIDEVEQLRKRDKDTYGSLISVLNAGFNKSGVVKRTEGTGKGGFIVKAYGAYSPKMFAGINEIDDVLQDRTVKIPLLRKKDDEPVDRYKETESIIKLQRDIRDDLYKFALSYAKDIADFYNKEGVEGISGAEHLNNRELDIWEPIFLMANVVDSQCGTRELTEMMTELSKTSAAEKQADNVTQNDTYKILGILQTMMTDLVPIEDENGIQTFEALQVFEYFKQTEDFGWLKYSNALTGKLKKVKVHSTQKRFGGDKKRVYYFKVKDIEDLCERFKI